MTENEAIERLKCMRLFMEISDKQNENKFLEDDYIANKIAICTIEEFKALKEKNETLKTLYEDARKEGNNLLARERNKAIDEFAETLKEKYEEHNFGLCLRQNDYYSYSNSCMLFENYIDKIAEQLKAGGKNAID